MKHSLVINMKLCPQELCAGLEEIQKEYPWRFARRATSDELCFIKDPSRREGGLAVHRGARVVTVRYGRKIDAFRALGRLMGELESNAISRGFMETPKLKTLGVMVDVSRNGVLTPDSARAFLRRCALMGINMMIFYTEDTYEAPGEPFFGYLRGRYTKQEISALDDYAHQLGVEMFPCIQTLGHLEQILKWPAYADYQDVPGVILAGEERTLKLLEKMLKAASGPFRSKRIHIGMDEAHGIGTGRYRQRHGEKRPFDVLNEHLHKVCALCRRLGLKPMIWSDMYFRLGSKTHDYYDRQCSIPSTVAGKIPKGVDLVYWDYYHTDKEFYADWIQRHRKLGFEPIMAGGVWTWNRFWTQMPFTITTTNACMQACKTRGLKEAFVTMWGDDGMECDIFSSLTGIQYFAEHGYADKVDERLLRNNFRGSCDGEYDDGCLASQLDAPPCLSAPEKQSSNPSKWLLYGDPLLGLLEPQAPGPLGAYYEKLARQLFAAGRKNNVMAKRLLFPAQLAKVLSLKCDLRRHVLAAYKKGDRRKLAMIVRNELRPLRRELKKLWQIHRQMWLGAYKPFGWEILEIRYGGLYARLATMEKRLQDYLARRLKCIPEMESPLHKIQDTQKGRLAHFNYSQCVTTCGNHF